MPTIGKNKRFQPLLDNENSNEEFANDEQKKERRKEIKFTRIEITNIYEACFVKNVIMKVI
jgi:hypothetical protein